jgi:uncharacterized LabA/DUF88 family protein
MPGSTRVFVDFWNFQLEWRNRAGGSQCDWPELPLALVAATQSTAPQLGALQLDDTRVYASADPDREGPLRKWLDVFLGRQPGFRVFVRERKARRKSVHCRKCKHKLDACPNCNTPYSRAVEKGVDSAIITDMFSLAWESAYDVAILVSSDSDMIPAVEKIQDRGLKIVNATWQRYGHDLARHCWASFPIDPLIGQLSRKGAEAPPPPPDNSN